MFGKGLKVTEGFVLPPQITALTCLPRQPALYLRITNDDPFLTSEWIEMVRRGIFLAGHHNHFINAALTDEDINRTMEAADVV